MTRAGLRRLLESRRKGLRAEVARARGQARASIAELAAPRRARRRRSRNLALLLLLLLLILILARCSCEPEVLLPEPSSPPEPPAEVTRAATSAPAKKPRPTPRQGLLARQGRASYEGRQEQQQSWLDDFRLQVTTRSVRLAACFIGADQPGALRWTCSVNPATGAVADHLLEPLGNTAGLSAARRDCVIEALSSPRYRLRAVVDPDGRSTPSRISMVLEF